MTKYAIGFAMLVLAATAAQAQQNMSDVPKDVASGILAHCKQKWVEAQTTPMYSMVAYCIGQEVEGYRKTRRYIDSTAK